MRKNEIIKDAFISEINKLIKDIDKHKEFTSKGKMQSLAYNILSIIDGENKNFPGFILSVAEPTVILYAKDSRRYDKNPDGISNVISGDLALTFKNTKD
jgi:hypothetical protein